MFLCLKNELKNKKDCRDGLKYFGVEKVFCIFLEMKKMHD